MNNPLIIAGLIVCAVIILIPVAMICLLLFRIGTTFREHQRAEARKVTAAVSDLGEFSSTNNRLWFGDVRGVHVTLETSGEPPSDTQAELVRTLLDGLPRYADVARSYLAGHEDLAWLNAGTETLQVFGIEPASNEDFVLEMTHPADADGVYRVEFRKGVPVHSGRDD